MIGIRTIAALAIAIPLSGCKPEPTEPDPQYRPVTLEQQTPDLAVKSLWKSIDEGDRVAAERCRRSARDSTELDQLRQLLTGVRLAHEERPSDCAAETFAREIAKVDIESDTRAVVLAQVRNATPIRDELLDEWDRNKRKEGERIKYLLERPAGSKEWKISETYVWERSYEPYKPGDYRRLYDPPYVDKHVFVHRY